MTGVETAAGGAIIKVAVERAAPAGIALVRSWLSGKTVMVVGPPRSGKTTFLHYLQFGIFQHSQSTPKTYEPQESPRFNLRLGANQSLAVSIKTAVDVPGQYAEPLAKEAFERRPHALLVILDLSTPLYGDDELSASATWLTEFCTRLDQKWQAAKASRNRLRTVIVVMNKKDLVDEAVAAEHEKAYRDVIASHFKSSRGGSMGDVLFRPCVMVETVEGTRWVDAVLVDMATALQR